MKREMELDFKSESSILNFLKHSASTEAKPLFKYLEMEGRPIVFPDLKGEGKIDFSYIRYMGKHPDVGPYRIKGQYVDVNRLFSNGGTSEVKHKYDHLIRPSNNNEEYPFSLLQDKYLVICCISLPMHYNYVIESMKSAYRELRECTLHIEMVIVADNTCSKSDFDEFFSTFPGLTIPFEDSVSRNYVCKSLGLGSSKDEKIVGFILDMNHFVVQNNFGSWYFSQYGAGFFPFTDEKANHLETLKQAFGIKFEYNISELSELSLADLFSCDPFLKLKRLREGDDEISVLELSKKDCVGIYFCNNHYMLPTLAAVHKECKDNNLEFEIVVVCVQDNEVYAKLEQFERSSAEYDTTSSWWRFPCNDRCTRWLIGVCEHSFGGYDSLVIVRPDGKFWDKSARTILMSDGIASYPITGEGIHERITLLTVEFLLGGKSQQLTKVSKLPQEEYEEDEEEEEEDTDDEDDDPYLVADLHNKNVLVYLYYPKYYNDFMEPLRDAYDAGVVSDLEVVLVPVDKYESSELTFCDEMASTWRMLPPPWAGRVPERAFTKSELVICDVAAVIAFGKDGRIRSRRAHNYLGDPQQLCSLFASDGLSAEEARSLHRKVNVHLVNIGEFGCDPE